MCPPATADSGLRGETYGGVMTPDFQPLGLLLRADLKQAMRRELSQRMAEASRGNGGLAQRFDGPFEVAPFPINGVASRVSRQGSFARSPA